MYRLCYFRNSNSFLFFLLLLVYFYTLMHSTKMIKNISESFCAEVHSFTQRFLFFSLIPHILAYYKRCITLNFPYLSVQLFGCLLLYQPILSFNHANFFIKIFKNFNYFLNVLVDDAVNELELNKIKITNFYLSASVPHLEFLYYK